MGDEEIRAALQQHWIASDANDFEVEHDIYRDDAVLDYPQSGERIRGRRRIQESRTVQPNKKRFSVRRIIGNGRNAFLYGESSATAISGSLSSCSRTMARPRTQ